MNILQRKDIIAFGITIVFVSFIGTNMIYKSYLNNINVIKSQIEEEKKKNEIIWNIAVLDKKVQVYKQRCFSVPEITPVLDKISELAERSGIKIETFNPLAAVHKEEYVELPIELPLSCPYHSLGTFLALIETNREFIKVKRLKINKPTVTEANQTKMPRIDVTLCGLYLK